MRIERVEVFSVAVPLIGEFRSAHGVELMQTSVVLRMTGTGGAIGLGNVDPFPGYSSESVEETLHAVEAKFAPAVIGLDPRNIHRVMKRMESTASGYLDAKAVVEMACVDLAARTCNLPVHTYLGGATRDRLLFNAWIGILPPEEAAAEALEWRRRGFQSAKIKVGGGIAADRDRVRAVREVVGTDFALRIDANAGYDAETSIQLARLMAPFDLQLFEQPVPAEDIAGMSRVRREAGGIPIMADESVLDHASLIRIIRLDAADLVKLKVMKQGGIYSTRHMIATAEAAGVRCVVGHGFGLGVNTIAEIMVAASSDNVIDGLECVGPLKTADDIVTAKVNLGSGSIALPHGPGFGLTLDEDKLKRYGTRTATIS